MPGTNITIDTSTAGQITIAGSLGDDAFDWATEGNTDVIPTDKLPGETVHHATAAYDGTNLNITINGNETEVIGDLLTFAMPSNLPTTSALILIHVNGVTELIHARDGNTQLLYNAFDAGTRYLFQWLGQSTGGLVWLDTHADDINNYVNNVALTLSGDTLMIALDREGIV